MPKDVFQFSCPCCGKRVEVNVRSGKARAVDPKERSGPDLDALIDEQARASERLGSMFDEAKQDQRSQADKLDRLFSEAAEDAKKKPDERPSNPFDLD